MTLLDQLLRKDAEGRETLLREALVGWVAAFCGIAVEEVRPDKLFSHHHGPWRNAETLRRDLDPWVKCELGLGAFYAGEIEGRKRPALLAAYLAEEVVPPPPEPEPFEDPFEGVPWGWPPPRPYGGRRIEGRVALVLGAGRSGTTMLRAMLGGHPEVFAPPEINLLPFDDLGERRRQIAERGAVHMLGGLSQCFGEELGGWEAGNRRVEEMEAAGMPVADAYEAIWSLRPSAPWLVDKSPCYASHVDWLSRAEHLFDEPRYIHLTRHPGAVIESMVRMRFRRLGDGRRKVAKPWAEAEKLWARTNSNILRFLDGIPAQRQMHVRYEDVVSRTEEETRRLCGFLGLDHHVGVTTPYGEGRMLVGGGDRNITSRDRIDPALAEAWREAAAGYQMSGFTRELAAHLGYPECAEPSA